MSNQDLDQLFGPSGHGDYSPGDTITFTENGHTLSGEIIHCAAPQTTVRGRHLPTSYSVDCEDGFPHIVTQSQIVAK
jgi:hypothetical protein